jgi:hypothetical protein
VSLRPAEVHPEQHLRPVRRFRATGAGADRQQRAPIVVLAGEEELRPLSVEIPFEGGGLAIQLRGQLGIARFLDELKCREEVLGTRVEAAPELDLGSKSIGFAENPLRRALVVPEARCCRLRVEVGDAPLLRL